MTPGGRWGVRLRDGSEAILRPVEPGDRGRLDEHLASLSPETLYLRFFNSQVPTFPRSIELIDLGLGTGLTGANKELVSSGIDFQGTFSPGEQGIYWDPQTSGGLFFGIQSKEADRCLQKLRERGVQDARIVAESFPTERPHLEIVR